MDQKNAVLRDNGRRTRFGHTRVEFSFPVWQDRLWSRLGPVEQIGGNSQARLVPVVHIRTKEIHPVLAPDFLWHDRARLRPASIPVSLIGRQDDSLAFPM